MTLHLVFNPKSGRGHGKNIAETAKLLCEEQNARLVLHPIENPKLIDNVCARAVGAAQKDGGVVAAAGGDGTIRAVAQHARDTDVRVAAIPCGTFNLFARNHNIPLEPADALKLALTGETKPVRLADINGEVFILNASMGLYAKAIRERKARTKRFGRHRIVAILSTLKSMAEGHSLLDIEMSVDGKPKQVKTTMVFIGNNALQLSDLKLDVANCMNKNLLAVVTLKPLTTAKMIRFVFHGLTKTLESAKDLDSFCAEEMIIKTNHTHVEIALDGEMFKMKSPLKIKALPNSIQLIKN